MANNMLTDNLSAPLNGAVEIGESFLLFKESVFGEVEGFTP